VRRTLVDKKNRVDPAALDLVDVAIEDIQGT
jgi:hypothetical protein